MKPFIENVSLSDIEKGIHYDAGENSMLIQIVDTGHEFPTPKYKFKEIHQFSFLDVDNSDSDKLIYKDAITDKDATKIADILKRAYNNNMNVIVHCHMGICRSGAVAEVGVMMGFLDTEKFRAPNMMVKSKLMEKLFY